MAKRLGTVRGWLDAGSNSVIASLAAGACAVILWVFVDAILSQTSWAISGNVALFIAVGWAVFAGLAMYLYIRRVPE